MKQMKLTALVAAGATIVATAALAQTRSTTTTTNGGTTGTTTSASTTTTGTGNAGSSTTTTTTTTEGTGTVAAYTAGQDYITFRTETSSEPVRYYYTPQTTIVDSEGHTVAWSALQANMPVRYTYVREGDRMIIKKITVTKPVTTVEKETTTTTTTTTTKRP